MTNPSAQCFCGGDTGQVSHCSLDTKTDTHSAVLSVILLSWKKLLTSQLKLMSLPFICNAMTQPRHCLYESLSSASAFQCYCVSLRLLILCESLKTEVDLSLCFMSYKSTEVRLIKESFIKNIFEIVFG